MKKSIKKLFLPIFAFIVLAVMAIGVALLCVGARTQVAQAATGGGVLEVTSSDGTTTSYGTFAEGWNAAVSAESSESNRVTVKLLADVTATDGSFGTGDGFGASVGYVSVPEGKYVTLDLNGRTLNRGLASATMYGHVIDVGGNLILNDSSGNNAGKITGGYERSHGGGVYVKGHGTFTMNGGTISGNTSQNGSGSGVYVDLYGTFTMNGGMISGNTATSGSGGGGVFVSNNSSFTMSGGTISGNTANYGGGVYVNGTKSTFYLSGDANITGNKVIDMFVEKNGNFFLKSGKKITISDGSTFTGEIGVTTENPPTSSITLTSGWGASTGKITSDNSEYGIGVDGGEKVLKLKTEIDVVEVNGTQYTDFAEGWNAAVSVESSESNRVTVKLLADVTATGGSFGKGDGFGSGGAFGAGSGYVLVPVGKYITLDLNGFTLSRGLTSITDFGHVIDVDGDLELTDSNGNNVGKITGGNKNGYGGGVCVSKNGSFTMNGGTISGNIARDYGGGVYVEGTFTMSGGTISDNKANYGGGVFIDGTFTMNGCTINNNIAKANGGGVFVSGIFNLSGDATVTGNKAGDTDAEKTDNVCLKKGKTLTISDGSTFSGEIGVNAPQEAPTSDAPITLTFGWGASTGKITSDNTEYAIGLNGGEKVLKVKTDVVEVNGIKYTDFAEGWNAAVSAASSESNPVTVKLLDNVAAENGSFGTGAGFGNGLSIYETNTGNIFVPNGTNITLDLNGFTLNRGLTEATGDGQVIKVSGNLELTDSSTNKDGVITGGNTPNFGGGVYVDIYSTFTMSGGTISGNASQNGGGVYVNGTFTMSGGTISGNTANDGGGVYLISVFNLNGGTISGNEANNGGGGVYIFNGTFTMSGGNIGDNTANTNGGGIFVVSGTFNLSGDANVTDNRRNSADNNIYLNNEYNEIKIMISDGDESSSGVMFSGTVGVSNTGEVATGYTQDDKASLHFLSDDSANNCVYVTDNGTVNIGAHTGGTATCSAKAVCANCGEEYGERNGDHHSFGNATYTWSSNSCTAERVCANDSTHKESETVTATSVTIAPTCTEGGYDTLTATFTNTAFATQTKKVNETSANGHTEKTIPAVAATCTATGLTAGKKCSVCDTVIAEQQTIPKIDHTLVTDRAIEATCTQEGKTEGKHCSVCGTVTVAQETIPKIAHTLVSDPAVEATCTQEGKTEGKHCSVCDTVTVVQETIPKIAHTLVSDPAVEATCTQEGKTEGKHCSVCDTVTVVQETIPKIAHTLVSDPAVKATCTQEGKTEGKHCSVCGTVTVVQETIPRIAHTLVTDPAVEATCTETGLTEGKHCSVCGTVTVAQETIPKIAHTLVSDPAVEATCTETGLTEGKHCSVCGTVIKAQETVQITDHSYGNWIDEVPATATEDGTKGHKDCSVCNKHFDNEGNEIEYLTIPATGVPQLPESERVTITVSGGSFEGAEGSSLITEKDGTVTVVAPEVEGKTFMGWSTDGGETIISNAGSYTFTATRNLNLTAVYEDTVPDKGKDGLSGGAIAGITVGSFFFVLIVLYVTGLVLYKKHIISWKICKSLYFFIK